MDDLQNSLERIAIALEQIALLLENMSQLPMRGNKFTETFQEQAHNSSAIGLESIDSDNNFLDDKNEQENNPILQFLEKKGIIVKTLPPEDPADQILDSLALFLGEHYDTLRILLSKIKKRMQTGEFLTLSLQGRSQKEVSDTCQFCSRLYDIAFLEQYKYFKSPQYLIKAKTTTLPSAQNFFSGKWLERYALLSVKQAISELSLGGGKDLDFAYLLNPQVILPNGDDFELDLIFHVNKTIFWMEAKSGNYQQHIAKYSKISRLLGLPTDLSIMILPDISSYNADALSSLFSMKVCTLDNLASYLKKAISIFAIDEA